MPKNSAIGQKDNEDVEIVASCDNTCIFCGIIIPEGRMICHNCERDLYESIEN